MLLTGKATSRLAYIALTFAGIDGVYNLGTRQDVVVLGGYN